tara:strand:- start:56 stop:457 length:402 start_codon:yes stop_codon:yes gene_type:complete
MRKRDADLCGIEAAKLLYRSCEKDAGLALKVTERQKEETGIAELSLFYDVVEQEISRLERERKIAERDPNERTHIVYEVVDGEEIPYPPYDKPMPKAKAIEILLKLDDDNPDKKFGIVRSAHVIAFPQKGTRD